MDFSTCYNCGEPGHFARDCPSPASRRPQPGRWVAAPRRDNQHEINERGVALCRRMLSDRHREAG